MARELTGHIDENDCMGDSLGPKLGGSRGTINQNFYNLDTATQELSGKIRTLTLSNTNIFYINASSSPSSFRGTFVTGGNDSVANGTTTKPFQTLTACVEYIYNKKDLGGGGVSIYLCPGSYKGCFFRGGAVGTSTTTQAFNTVAANAETPLTSTYLTIQGDSASNTFINQYKEGAFWNGSGVTWRHLHLEGIIGYIENVTFRYNSSVDPVEGATSTPTVYRLYNHLQLSFSSFVTIQNCVFEAAPNLQTNVNGYTSPANFTTPELIVVSSKSTLYMVGNNTINNYINGAANSSTAPTARIFLLVGDYGAAYMYGTLTLVNDPRFNIVYYTGRYARLYQHPQNFWTADPNSEKFQYTGLFGTQTGTGANESFTGEHLRASNLRNFLLLNEQFSENYIFTPTTTSGRVNLRVRPAANDASIFSIYNLWT